MSALPDAVRRLQDVFAPERGARVVPLGGGLDHRAHLAEWRDEAAELAAGLGGELPDGVRRALERRFDAAPPAAAPGLVFETTGRAASRRPTPRAGG